MRINKLVCLANIVPAAQIRRLRKGIVIVMKEKQAEQMGIRTLQYPQGLKWTRQRKDVYEILRQAREPLSAVQIYNKLDKSDSEDRYALSTVYRILTAFEEKGFINKTTWMGDGTVVYELNRGEHTHYAVCLQCHKRIPLSYCPFAHLHLEEDADDFTITSHKLELYGYCKDCKQ